MEKRLTESANSGIGSGNLYSAALQTWFVKEEESESGKLCGFLVNEEKKKKKGEEAEAEA